MPCHDVPCPSPWPVLAMVVNVCQTITLPALMPCRAKSWQLPAPMPVLSRTPPNWHSHTGRYDGQEARHYQSPWMRGMYVGQLDSEQVRLQGNGGYRCNSCCRTKSNMCLVCRCLMPWHAPLRSCCSPAMCTLAGAPTATPRASVSLLCGCRAADWGIVVCIRPWDAHVWHGTAQRSPMPASPAARGPACKQFLHPNTHHSPHVAQGTCLWRSSRTSMPRWACAGAGAVHAQGAKAKATTA